MGAHYASALFRYQKEFTVKYRSYCSFVFMDDKHHCKVGELSNPAAAVDGGKRVIVSLDRKFAVADHDHTKCSLVPSVVMVCSISPTIKESFYRSRVIVGMRQS